MSPWVDAPAFEADPRRIVIVGSRAWRPRLLKDFQGLGGGPRDSAAAVLRYLHDIHVGVTPELAAGLARALGSEARDRAASGVWSGVFERLEDQLLPGGGKPGGRTSRRTSVGGGTRRRYTGMVPASAMFYTVARIAAPLIARASEKLEQIYLFAADPEPCPEDFEQQYARYSAELAHRLRALATSDELSEVFWTDRAFSLKQLSRSAVDESRAELGVPDVDAVALGQLLRLDPRQSDPPSPRQSMPKRLTTSPRFRPLMSRNEGGVDGIYKTRRLSDLSDILMSEFIYPRPLLLERLLRSGYLALRRPPLREKQRDVMLVGILPPAPKGSSSSMRAGLIKATWFDAMVRFATWLTRAGLRRSEFLWLEADESARPRASRCRLDDLPENLPLSARLPERPTPAYRKEMLAALGWLPDYLDRNAAGTAPPASSDVFDWCVSARQTQRDHQKAYDTIHVMLFLPRKVEKLRSIGVFRHTLGLPVESGYSVSVTWTPETLTDLDADTGWAFSAERKPVRPFETLLNREARGPDAGFENTLAGALLDVWLKTILEELVRDD